MVQGNCLLVNKLITLCFPLGPNQIQLEGIYGSRSSISSVVAIGGEALKVEKGRESINATSQVCTVFRYYCDELITIAK